MRILLITIFILIITACDQTNLLTYKNRKNYSEDNVITNDSLCILEQSICYHKPGVLDDGFCYVLFLKFHDLNAAKRKKILNLESDTLIVTSRYAVLPALISEKDNNKVTGQIEIINWNKDKITLKENLLVSNSSRNEIKKYKGSITFNKEK